MTSSKLSLDRLLPVLLAAMLMSFGTGLSVWPAWHWMDGVVLADSPAAKDVHGQAKFGVAPDPRVKYYRGAFDACRLFAQGVGDDELTATFNCLGFIKQLSDASYYEASEAVSGTP